MANISNNHGFGIYSILINESYGNFMEDDEPITNCENFLLITGKEWNILRMNKSSSNNDNDNKNIKSIKKIIYPKKFNHKHRKYRKNI